VNFSLLFKCWKFSGVEGWCDEYTYHWHAHLKELLTLDCSNYCFYCFQWFSVIIVQHLLRNKRWPLHASIPWNNLSHVQGWPFSTFNVLRYTLHWLTACSCWTGVLKICWSTKSNVVSQVIWATISLIHKCNKVKGNHEIINLVVIIGVFSTLKRSIKFSLQGTRAQL